MSVEAPAAAQADPTLPGGPLPAGVAEKFVDAGGVKFRYLEGGSPQGAPILFIHGWPTWAEVWLPTVAMLPNDRRWIAVDLPNHGKSGILKGKASLTSLKTAMLAFFDALALDHAAVVGCSIGGTLAVMIALARPAKVDRIVPIDAAGFAAKLPGKTVRMYLPFFIGAMFGAPKPKGVRKLLIKTVFANPEHATDAWVNAVTAAFAPKDRRKALLRVGGALRKKDASVGAQVSQVRCPTLVLWGAKDAQFDWHIGEAAAGGILGGKFAAIEGAGHFPMVEETGRTAEKLIPFLAGK